MNDSIKREVEDYVLNDFKLIKNLNQTDAGYYDSRNSIVKEISTMIDLLQKEDVNDNNSKFNEEKIKNEITKIDKDHQLNLKKLESENNKDKNILDLEKEKIKNSSQLENRKINSDEKKNNSDTELKNKELKIELEKDIDLRCDRIIKVLVDGTTILVPIIFYSVWMRRGIEFEKTGTFTSTTFKNLISKFKLTK